MSFIYLPFKEDLLDATAKYDFDSGGGTIGLLMAMSNTTCDTETNISNLAAFADIDEYDGAGYSRQTLSSQLVTLDVANSRAEFDAADVVISSVSAGTRQCQGIVIYYEVSAAEASRVPVMFIDTGGFPFAGNGGDITFQWDAEGILHIT